MSFEVTVIKEFAAAHRLNNYSGNCSRVHGHTWKIELVVAGKDLDDIGMHIDFRYLKSVLSQIIDVYDHTYLNEIEPFNEINPTAENVAKEIYQKATELLVDYKVQMVKVWESSSAYVTYKEEYI
ncbi:MAG TPA: 6-carboxytetrahydropterin synthase QueD [Syntrophomonadaceae bacterium]|nr:6-carboxytetrahydropterin synthase QueD [Syntrophomonadaceae bacterium]